LILVAIAIGWGREIVTSASGDQLEPGGLAWILPVLAAVVLLAAVAGLVTWYFSLSTSSSRSPPGWWGLPSYALMPETPPLSCAT
jgi:flagellar basal body-associated protein FliL